MKGVIIERAVNPKTDEEHYVITVPWQGRVQPDPAFGGQELPSVEVLLPIMARCDVATGARLAALAAQGDYTALYRALDDAGLTWLLAVGLPVMGLSAVKALAGGTE